jgi:carboxypeptidase family protein
VRVLNSSLQEVTRTQTDASGRFQLATGLEPKTYTLEVGKEGFQTMRKTVELPSATRVEVALIRQCLVQGTVRLADGSVVVGAVLRFSKSGSIVAEAKSGQDGSYVATGLGPGEYAVVAESADSAYMAVVPSLQLTEDEPVHALNLELSASRIGGKPGDGPSQPNPGSGNEPPKHT